MLKNKRILLLVVLAVLLLFSSSCVNRQNDASIETPSQSSPDSNSLNSGEPSNPSPTIRRYDVYESNGDEPDEFSIAMANNPIDQKMNEDLKTVDISSTRGSQVFYSGYVEIWQKELAFSINNLEKYLSPDDLKSLEAAQSDWEKAWQANSDFDIGLIGGRGIGLGTQYVTSGLLYLIGQYRDRDAHVKYMTYLAENYVDDPVPQADQMWNQFFDPQSSITSSN